MPKVIDIPEYGPVEFPDNMSDEQIALAIQQNLSPKTKPQSGYGEVAKNLGAGALMGAADIGNTLINVASYPLRKLSPQIEEWNANRERGLQDFANQYQDSTAFDVGRIGANIAGTAGVGGALGGGLAAASKSKAALDLANAIKTGGLSSNVSGKMNLLGGATQAAIGSALIDPEAAKTGAAIGAAVPLAGRAAPYVGGKVADVIGGTQTFTGGQPIREAAKAGLKGGESATKFTQNLRGEVPITEVLDDAKMSLQNIANERNALYRQNIQAIRNDKSVLSFDGIDNALNNAFNKVTYNGKVKNQAGADTFSKIQTAIDEWKNSDPAIYHTPEGLDALKQRVGGIVESIPYNEKTARSVGNEVYNSIKSSISNQAPTYSKTMKDYSEASDLIREIEGSLIGTSKTNPDTALRKLQSVMRNNVNTNYGRRQELARALESQGGEEIFPALAGQSLSSWTPRGLGSVVSGGTLAASYFNPSVLGLLATQSPRLMGEAAYGVGKAARGVKQASKVAPSIEASIAAALNR